MRILDRLRLRLLTPCALGIVVIFCAAGSATAEPPTETGESEELAKAREKFREGLARQAAGNWTAALRLFKEVAAVRSTPQVRFNIALCHEKLGKWVEAVGAYRLALADARLEKALDVEREASTRAEALAHRIPTLVLRRGQGAETAQIQLDGASLGEAVLGKPIAVDPGPHTVGATAEGFRPLRAAVRLDEGEKRAFLIELEPAALPFVLQDRRPRSGPNAAKVTGYAVGAVAILSLVGSGVSFVLAQSEQDDLEAKGCNVDTGICTAASDGARRDLEASLSTRDDYATLGNVLLGIGAGGLAVSATLLLVGDDDGPGVAVLPRAQSALFGSTLVGRF